MIDKYVARGLLPLVNDPLDMQSLIEYANYRMNLLRTELENLTEINDILRVQGQIKELKRFLTLRDEAIKDSS